MRNIMLFGNKKKSAKYIVDVHCHIMPRIDDGSRNMTETIKIGRASCRERV